MQSLRHDIPKHHQERTWSIYGKSVPQLFIERADAMTLDAGCLTELRRPPFVTSPVGWRP